MHTFPPLLLLLVQTVVDVAQGKELSVVVHITVSKTVIMNAHTPNFWCHSQMTQFLVKGLGLLVLTPSGHSLQA